jgi:hypothetical protein
MNAAIWTTLEGAEIPVVDLEDLHLQRIVRMGLRAARSALARESGEVAGGLTPEEADARYREELAPELLPLLQRRLLENRRFAPLLAEARRRGVGVFAAAHCD